MSKVLLDTNIILDFILKREPFYINAEKILKYSFENTIQSYISATTITDIYYIVKKQKNKDEALDFLNNLIDFVSISDVNREVVINSLNSNFKDLRVSS